MSLQGLASKQASKTLDNLFLNTETEKTRNYNYYEQSVSKNNCDSISPNLVSNFSMFDLCHKQLIWGQSVINLTHFSFLKTVISMKCTFFLPVSDSLL